MSTSLSVPERTADAAPPSAPEPPLRRPERAARLRRVGLRVVAVAALLALWQLVVWLELWPPVLVPSPAAVWHALLETSGTHDGVRGYQGHTLIEHLGISLRRIVIGAGAGAAAGLATGVLMGTLPWVRVVLEPAVAFLRTLPPLAYFSLLIIWFGIDEAPKLWLLAIAAMPPVAVATASAVASAPTGLVEAARAIGARRGRPVRVRQEHPAAADRGLRAGLVREVVVNGEIPEPGRQAGIVFQQPRLFPWRTVGDNVGQALRYAGVPRDERAARTSELLERVGLADTAHRRIWQISGGQQQRVAIARALAGGKRLLLLDEPFAALGALTRERLQEDLRTVGAETGTTAVFVTHSVDEAVFLGTRTVVLTARPGTVALDVPIGLPRTGVGPDELRGLPEYAALRAEIGTAVRDAAR